MTKATGDKVYVCAITIWVPLPSHVADALEKQCREWRTGNLSSEERELAESLGAKLAFQWRLLSSLFQQRPFVTGSQVDEIEEQISQCQEKITLLNDLLVPIRLHAAARVEGLTEGQGMWIPRCYGLLGREEGYQNVWKEWLRAIAVPWVSDEVDVGINNVRGATFLPLERYVVNLCGEIPLPIQGKNQVEIAVRELRHSSHDLQVDYRLYAAKEEVTEIPGWRDVVPFHCQKLIQIDLYPLFRALSLKNIIILFEATLSEARIIFRSSYPAMLHVAARALTHLIWPLKYSGIYIPVLPGRLLSCLDVSPPLKFTESGSCELYHWHRPQV
jgi:hypothetical protein